MQNKAQISPHIFRESLCATFFYSYFFVCHFFFGEDLLRRTNHYVVGLWADCGGLSFTYVKCSILHSKKSSTIGDISKKSFR
jgi:hypothetical protein